MFGEEEFSELPFKLGKRGNLYVTIQKDDMSIKHLPISLPRNAVSIDGYTVKEKERNKVLFLKLTMMNPRTEEKFYESFPIDIPKTTVRLMSFHVESRIV